MVDNVTFTFLPISTLLPGVTFSFANGRRAYDSEGRVQHYTSCVLKNLDRLVKYICTPSLEKARLGAACARLFMIAF